MGVLPKTLLAQAGQYGKHLAPRVWDLGLTPGCDGSYYSSSQSCTERYALTPVASRLRAVFWRKAIAMIAWSAPK
jgi:hypothetical protein